MTIEQELEAANKRIAELNEMMADHHKQLMEYAHSVDRKLEVIKHLNYRVEALTLELNLRPTQDAYMWACEANESKRETIKDLEAKLSTAIAALEFYSTCGEIYHNYQHDEDGDVEGAVFRFITDGENILRREAREALAVIRKPQGDS